MLIIAFHKVELTLRPPAWILYKRFIGPVDPSMQDSRRVTTVPSGQSGQRAAPTQTSLCFHVTGEKAAEGALLGPGNRPNCAGLIDQNLLKSVA